MKNLTVLNLVVLAGILVYLVYDRNQPEIHEEITTNRLNVIGEDGNKFVVISSPERQALATINGKTVQPEGTKRPVPGLLFFNQEGDEIGGLVFGIDSTSTYQLLTFDQRKGDQIMTLRKDERLVDGEWQKRYGLMMQERSDKPVDQFMQEIYAINAIKDTAIQREKFREFWSNPENQAPRRLFIGRTYAGDYGLFLMDSQNQTRLSIYVDSTGTAHIEKKDEAGKLLPLSFE